MKQHFFGFQVMKPRHAFGVGYVKANLPHTGETIHIHNEEFASFFVENGYVSETAVMGGCEVPEEILIELGFTLNGYEEADYLCVG
jgi:hypothetical protein